MVKMCFSFLLIFILITFQVEANNSCNDECFTKTYCISSDGSGVCSENNLVTAQFKAIPVFGEYDHLQLTLKGFNVTPDDEKTLKVVVKQHFVLGNTYTCYKSSNGSTDTRFERGTYNSTTGSSSYEEGVLSCTWTLTINDGEWPKRVDLFKESKQSITLYDDSVETLVAHDTSLFPNYHAQYLKCCNNAHGNDEVLFTFDQNDKQILYQLYYSRDYFNEMSLTLTRKDGIQLLFKCHLYWKNALFDGYIINGTESISVDLQLIKPAVIKREICSWSTPFVLGDSRISIDASTSVFDLQFAIDSFTIYTENNVTLKN